MIRKCLFLFILLVMCRCLIAAPTLGFTVPTNLSETTVQTITVTGTSANLDTGNIVYIYAKNQFTNREKLQSTYTLTAEDQNWSGTCKLTGISDSIYVRTSDDTKASTVISNTIYYYKNDRIMPAKYSKDLIESAFVDYLTESGGILKAIVAKILTEDFSTDTSSNYSVTASITSGQSLGAYYRIVEVTADTDVYITNAITSVNPNGKLLVAGGTHIAEQTNVLYIRSRYGTANVGYVCKGRIR